MAKSKVRTLDVVARGRLAGLAAQLAAASGEDAIDVAQSFAVFVAARPVGETPFVALAAAVAEGAGRHEHLRGRKPLSLAGVLARAEQFVAFIGADGAAEPAPAGELAV